MRTHFTFKTPQFRHKSLWQQSVFSGNTYWGHRMALEMIRKGN